MAASAILGLASEEPLTCPLNPLRSLVLLLHRRSTGTYPPDLWRYHLSENVWTTVENPDTRYLLSRYTTRLHLSLTDGLTIKKTESSNPLVHIQLVGHVDIPNPIPPAFPSTSNRKRTSNERELLYQNRTPIALSRDCQLSHDHHVSGQEISGAYAPAAPLLPASTVRLNPCSGTR